MKSKVLKIIALGILAFLASSFFGLVKAQDNNVRRVQIVEPQDGVKDFYFAASQDIEVRGDFNSDVFVFGENVTINGNIDGDLVVAGGHVVVKGNVSHNIFAAGGDVSIEGIVGNNLIGAAGNLVVSENAMINGGLVSAGRSVSINAPVAGRVEVAGQTINLSNRIGGNVDAASENLILTQQASISGRLKVYSDNDISKSEGASVSGGVEKHPLPKASVPREEVERGRLAGRVVGYLGNLLLGLVLIKFFSKHFDLLSETITKDPMNTALNGLLVLLVVPVVCLLLLVTIIGAPVAGFVFAIYAFILSMSKFLAGYYLGKYVFKIENNYKALALGLTLLYVTYMVIFVSGLVKLVSSLLALGSLWVGFRTKNFNRS